MTPAVLAFSMSLAGAWGCSAEHSAPAPASPSAEDRWTSELAAELRALPAHERAEAILRLSSVYDPEFFLLSARRRGASQVRVEYQRGNVHVFHLDVAGKLVRTEWRPATLGGRNATKVFTYGAEGKLVRTQEDTSDVTFHPLTITTEYDYERGRLVRKARREGQQRSDWIAYRYDAKGRLESVHRGWSTEDGQEEVSDTAKTDAQGGLVAIESAHGSARKSFRYDDAGRLVSYRPSAGQEWLFEYDAAGRIRKALHNDDETSNTRRTYWMAWDERGLPKMSMKTENGDVSVCIFTINEGAVTAANCGGEVEFTVTYTVSAS